LASSPLLRRLSVWFAGFVRWCHIYVSMLGLAAVLFFSATGVTLNHPDWFFGEMERTTRFEGQIDPGLLRGHSGRTPDTRAAAEPANDVARLEVVERLRQAHGIRGALAEFRVDDAECVVAFKGPGYAADAFIDRDSGQYSLTQTFHGIIGVLNDLHKGRDTGPAWSVLIDASAVLLVFISLSGLVLLFYLKLRRWPGLVVALVGLLIVLAFFFWMIA
jgi:hypothetical protein